MPYRGDSPVEAWEFWFDAPPTERVRSALRRIGKDHAAAEIIEAIETTFDKRDITSDSARVNYIKGILNRRLLQRLSPDRAAEEHQIDALQSFWRKRRHLSRGEYFSKTGRNQLALWLRFFTVPEIQAVMWVARSWDDLCDEVERIESQHRAETERRVFTAYFRNVKMIVMEFIGVEETGFVAHLQKTTGEDIGDPDRLPKSIDAAKLLVCRWAAEYVSGDDISAESILTAVKDSWVETVTRPDHRALASVTFDAMRAAPEDEPEG